MIVSCPIPVSYFRPFSDGYAADIGYLPHFLQAHGTCIFRKGITLPRTNMGPEKERLKSTVEFKGAFPGSMFVWQSVINWTLLRMTL